MMSSKDEDELLPHVIRLYEQRLTRYDVVHSKATNQIGFVGVIIAIFGFAFGENIALSDYLISIIIGLTLLLISIGISIILLIPKKDIPIFDVKRYADDKKAGKEVPTLFEMYTHFSKKLEEKTLRNNKGLYLSYILTISGLTMTFLGIIITII